MRFASSSPIRLPRSCIWSGSAPKNLSVTDLAPGEIRMLLYYRLSLRDSLRPERVAALKSEQIAVNKKINKWLASSHRK